jgi:hypothetical protein
VWIPNPILALSWYAVFRAPLGAIWFYDVTYPAYTNPIPPQIQIRHSDFRANSLNYEDYKLQHLLQYLPNHYTGNEGFGNYGYLNVNGYWIDPDSKGEIFDAENGLLGASHSPNLPIGIAPVPKLTEDEMYAGFMEEVSNGVEGDEEGDPRSMYITPTTFARWAVGASQGDSYVLGKAEPQASHAIMMTYIHFSLKDFELRQNSQS